MIHLNWYWILKYITFHTCRECRLFTYRNVSFQLWFSDKTQKYPEYMRNVIRSFEYQRSEISGFQIFINSLRQLYGITIVCGVNGKILSRVIHETYKYLNIRYLQVGSIFIILCNFRKILSSSFVPQMSFCVTTADLINYRSV